MVNGFLERHEEGWLANNSNNNSSRREEKGGGKGEGEGRGGVAGWSALYQSLSKVTYKNNLI